MRQIIWLQKHKCYKTKPYLFPVNYLEDERLWLFSFRASSVSEHVINYTFLYLAEKEGLGPGPLGSTLNLPLVKQLWITWL